MSEHRIMDLTERLRVEQRNVVGKHPGDVSVIVATMDDGAREIERLRAENAELRDLLTEVADWLSDPCRYDHDDYCQTHYSNRPCIAERLSTYRTEESHE